MQKEIALGVVRHVLTGAGVLIASKGVLDQVLVNEAIGGLMTLVSVGWSAWAKRAK